MLHPAESSALRRANEFVNVPTLIVLHTGTAKADLSIIDCDLAAGVALRVKWFRRTKVVGIGINSIGLSDQESRGAAEQIQQETGLPTIDAFRFGAAPLADALIHYFSDAKQ